MNKQESIGADKRGAVMVIAVFMAAFLVGILWYLIGIGDAAVYRETMQDGADATAFAAAVYHARGMNVIAMLNLIMAAVLAVLVALKIAQVLLVFTNVVSCLLAETGIGAAVCAATTDAEEPLQTAITNTERVVDKVLKGLNLASTGVAVGMPWVAEAKAVTVANQYAPTMHGGFILSASLVPLVSLGKESGGKSAETAPTAGASGGKAGKRLGLPVMNDDFTVLCGRAGRDVAALALEPFSSFGIPTEWAEKMASGVVDTFPGYFCGGSGKKGVDNSKAINKAAEEICARTKAQVEKYNQDNPKKTPKEYDHDKCMDGAKKSASKKYGDSSSGAGADPMEGSEKKASKRVFDAAQNGDDYFGIWSLGWGDLKSQSNGQRGVDIAAWNKTKASDPSFLSKSVFAKAEFYYDIEKGGAARPKWDSYKDDAMWNMRWRARLRRVKSPTSKLGALAATSIGDRMNDYMGSWLGNSDAAHAAIDWAKTWPDQMTEAVDQQMKDTTGVSARENGFFTVIH